MLDYFDHNARCTLLDLVPEKLGKDLLLAMDNMENEDVDTSSSDKDVQGDD
jgi:hypothetical protein